MASGNTVCYIGTQIAYRYGRRTHEVLREAGAAVHFRSYPRVGHFTTPEEIEEVVSFFETALSAKAKAAS